MHVPAIGSEGSIDSEMEGAWKKSDASTLQNYLLPTTKYTASVHEYRSLLFHYLVTTNPPEHRAFDLQSN